MSGEDVILYTIGHSNLPVEEFLAHLRQHDIAVLVDVRSAPYSRYVPHFSKAPLAAFLRENGLDYRFAGEILGGRPKDETVYKQARIPEAGTTREQFRKLVDYQAIMQRDWYQKGIRRLLDIAAEASAQGQHVAMMCSEGNPRECHRHHLITRSLIDPRVRVVTREIDVRHILLSGAVETVSPAEFDQPEQPRLL